MIVRNPRKFCITLVFNSWSDSLQDSSSFVITDYYSQSGPNGRRYQKFLFGGVVVGLSVATRYRASRINAPTLNLATYHRILYMMVPGCDYTFEQDLEPSCLFDGFLLP
jgi:hypothetical protein